MADEVTVFKTVTGAKYYSNDIKLASALVTKHHAIVEVKSQTNPRNGKKEIIFGFEFTPECKADALAFISGSLYVDASLIMDNRDKLLSFVTNSAKNVIESLNNAKE